VAALAAPGDAGRAAAQVWPAFVLVTGLLALGLAADAQGLFEAAGGALARRCPTPGRLLVGGALLVAAVTAVLNLDTSVVFVTPVLLAAARRQGGGEAPLLYLSVLLANGASLLLPGSNLTNVIVIAGHRIGGATFAATMALPFVVAVVAVTAVVALAHRRALGRPLRPGPAPAGPPVRGWVAPAVAGVLVVALPPDLAAPLVLALGAVALGRLAVRHALTAGRVRRVLSLPVLVALFSLAVAAGTLGRVWDGPARLLAQVPGWASAPVGALSSVVVNNLPAAALFGAHPPPDPYALLVGLDLGPNLAVTGALSAVLWWRVARSAGARPSLARFSALGVPAAVVSMAGALGALALVR
jgi:arsenical pump membrane protein